MGTLKKLFQFYKNNLKSRGFCIGQSPTIGTDHSGNVSTENSNSLMKGE